MIQNTQNNTYTKIRINTNTQFTQLTEAYKTYNKSIQKIQLCHLIWELRTVPRLCELYITCHLPYNWRKSTENPQLGLSKTSVTIFIQAATKSSRASWILHSYSRRVFASMQWNAKNWNKIPRSSILQSLHRSKPSQHPWTVRCVRILLLKLNASKVKLFASTMWKTNSIHDSTCRIQMLPKTECLGEYFHLDYQTVTWLENIS
jgi:hypothetical protein